MRVLIATKVLAVFDALKDVKDIELEEALFSGQIYEGLAGTQMAIIDFEDVAPHPYSLDMLREVLAEKGVLFVSSQEFLSQPDRWLAEARAAKGEPTALPQQKAVAFVSYSGGTGKTILALDTAVHFARRTKMPVLLAEFTYGDSALAAMTGLDGPYLFDLATQLDVESAKYKGVTLVPMDYEYCRDLPVRQLAQYFEEQMEKHILMVVDSRWPHGLIGAVQDEIDEWLVVATPRIDAVENARRLRRELEEKERKASIIINQKSTADSLVLAGFEGALDLPRVRQPDRLEGQLGREILSLIYGKKIWRRYEPKGLLANLGRRLGFGGRVSSR
jgi:CO dehydrogenase nickel-insertion accessory protein CooC1